MNDVLISILEVFEFGINFRMCLYYLDKEIEFYCEDYSFFVCFWCVIIVYKKCEGVVFIEEVVERWCVDSGRLVNVLMEQFFYIEKILNDRRSQLEFLD